MVQTRILLSQWRYFYMSSFLVHTKPNRVQACQHKQWKRQVPSEHCVSMNVLSLHACFLAAVMGESKALGPAVPLACARRQWGCPPRPRSHTRLHHTVQTCSSCDSMVDEAGVQGVHVYPVMTNCQNMLGAPTLPWCMCLDV